jgi:hypothetical protein
MSHTGPFYWSQVDDSFIFYTHPRHCCGCCCVTDGFESAELGKLDCLVKASELYNQYSIEVGSGLTDKELDEWMINKIAK